MSGRTATVTSPDTVFPWMLPAPAASTRTSPDAEPTETSPEASPTHTSPDAVLRPRASAPRADPQVPGRRGQGGPSGHRADPRVPAGDAQVQFRAFVDGDVAGGAGHLQPSHPAAGLEVRPGGSHPRSRARRGSHRDGEV